MKLQLWLKTNAISRSAFAKRVGISPASITALCNDPKAWISRETAERIAAVTEGQVTPNDFLGLEDDTPPGGNVSAAIEAFARGEILIVTDDDDRENEGDLVLAAAHCTPDKMAFIIRHTCGIVCAPLAAEAARRLHLNPMVSANDAPLGTAFTVSVDVRHGLTTGISAEQRSNTVRALANDNMGAADFVRPGHVFPLIARDGGVLMRSGHTEAAIDLCRLAGLPLAAAICELANDDGTVKRGVEVTAFAAEHGLHQVTIADLIAYRQARETLVERIATFTVESPIGPLAAHAYTTPFDSVHHLAVVYGRIGEGDDVPVRLHRADIVADVFGGAPTINTALKKFAEAGRGVIVYLRDGTAGVPAGAVGGEAGSQARRSQQWLEIGLGAQILRDLGIRSIHLLSTKPRTYVGLAGFGIKIKGHEMV